MKIKIILPAVSKGKAPSLGLGTLMSTLDASDEIVVTAEQAQQPAMWDDAEIVVISVGSLPERACNLAELYHIAGTHVVLAGLEFGTMAEAAGRADTLFVGPADELWPAFVRDFRNGDARNCYMSEFTLCDAGLFVSPVDAA